MKIVDIVLLVASALGLAALIGFSVMKFPAKGQDFAAQLSGDVRAALDGAGHGDVRVEMDGQTARLSGPVASGEAALAIEDLVLAAAGPGGPVFGGVTTVESAFDEVAPVSPFVWRVTHTDNGKLILTGHVPDDASRDALSALADGLGGVELDDRTALAAGAPEGDWRGAAALGLRAATELDSGAATLEDTTLRVAGVAVDNARRARLSAEVANLAAPFVGKPDIRGPSLWSARHLDGQLVLDGEVASEDERTEILEIAEANFTGSVVDDMGIAGEAAYGGWLDGVRLGLPHFASFRSGFMGFDPEGIGGFVFDGEASGSTLAFLREDMSRLEGPFTAEVGGQEVLVDVAEIADIDFSGDARAACEGAFAAVLETNTVVFASGNAQISRESGQTLDKLMAVANRCDGALAFELGGHTDSSGERAYNVFLSEARAQAVADYMTARGFDGERLSVVGYGPDNPIADNANAEGRAANRRLEFKVLERSE